MPTAKERLSHLLELAAEGPARRATLAAELADLVLNWPADYPAAMRAPVLTLLEMTVRETDGGTLAQLAARLGGHGELPLDLVNEFFLYAPKGVRREILMRNELAGGSEDDGDASPDAAALVAAARDVRVRDFPEHLGAAMRIAPETAQAILADATAEALAVLCRGAHLDRAVFSALALLEGAQDRDPLTRLGAYDTVPQQAAERLTRHWRAHHAPPKHTQAAAAE